MQADLEKIAKFMVTASTYSLQQSIILNKQQTVKSLQKKETNGYVLSEAEALIYNMKSINSMMSTAVFSERDYVFCNFLPHMISNLKRYCVNGNSI